MKLERALFIGGVEYPLIHAETTLETSNIGGAVFTIRADAMPTGVVSFQAGYTTGRWYPVFLGRIKNGTARDAKSWILTCTEITATALLLPCPVSLRDCSVADVCADISRTLGINIDVASESYTSQRIPRFASTTDALTAVEGINTAFNLDLSWYQLPSGDLWIGHQSDSPQAKNQHSIPDELFHKQKSNQIATLPALPGLRPGMILNNKVLQVVRLNETETHIQWTL